MPSTTGGKVIVITGASAGIGRALAIDAARAGHRVVLVARRADRLAALAAEIRASGGACEAIEADVVAPDTPARIVDAAIGAFGRIDVVVNNAGSGSFGALLEVSDAAIDAQWQLHVAAPLRISRAALPHLRASHGQLIFVGSGVARVPIPNFGAYAAAKAAIRAVSIQLRRELKADGIAVTYVDPGKVATEFHATMGIESADDVPSASPERVARAILRGINKRSVGISGTPWQTFGTMIGEWSSTLADPTLIKMAPKKAIHSDTHDVTTTSDSDTTTTTRHAERSERSERSRSTSFDEAIAPLARRMERVNLSQDFVRELLVDGATLELNDVAMRWAGMPNKNERAALREVLDALVAAGFLTSTVEGSWQVVRSAG